MHYERYSLHSCSMISLFFFFTYTLSSSREISPQCPCSVSSDVKGEAEIFCSHVTLMTTPRMWVPGGLERRLLDPLSCAHLPELTQFLPSCSQNKFRSRVTGSQISLMWERETDYIIETREQTLKSENRGGLYLDITRALEHMENPTKNEHIIYGLCI